MLKIRASLFFRSEILLGNFLPTESERHCHCVSKVLGHEVRLFLDEEDMKRMPDGWHRHRDKALKEGHLVVRLFTAEFMLPVAETVVVAMKDCGASAEIDAM